MTVPTAPDRQALAHAFVLHQHGRELLLERLPREARLTFRDARQAFIGVAEATSNADVRVRAYLGATLAAMGQHDRSAARETWGRVVAIGGRESMPAALLAVENLAATFERGGDAVGAGIARSLASSIRLAAPEAGAAVDEHRAARERPAVATPGIPPSFRAIEAELRGRRAHHAGGIDL